MASPRDRDQPASLPQDGLHPLKTCSRHPRTKCRTCSPCIRGSARTTADRAHQSQPASSPTLGASHLQHLNASSSTSSLGRKSCTCPIKCRTAIADLAAANHHGLHQRRRPISLIKAASCADRRHVQGAVRALPDVPSLSETPALAAYELNNWFGLFAPAACRGEPEDPPRRGGEGTFQPQLQRSCRAGGIPSPGTPDAFPRSVSESGSFAHSPPSQRRDRGEPMPHIPPARPRSPRRTL